MKAKITVPIEIIREFFSLEVETGFLTWKKTVSKRMVGNKRAGSIQNNGYRVVSFGRRKILEHRLVYALFYGEWPNSDLDHINGIRDDNRPENLRLATKSQNCHNSAVSKSNTTGFKGVFKYKNRWRVMVAVSGKRMSFGSFDDIELADLVAQEARRKYHGEYARHA